MSQHDQHQREGESRGQEEKEEEEEEMEEKEMKEESFLPPPRPPLRPAMALSRRMSSPKPRSSPTSTLCCGS